MVAAIDWQTGATYIVIATAISGVLMVRVARAFKGERDATRDKVERLEKDFADEQVKQTALRHELKGELAAALWELGELRKVRDPTEVLQQVLTKLDTTVGTVAEILQRSEERAAARDQAIIETQRQIVDRLEKLADRIVGQVAEVVQKKVDELQPDSK